MTGAVATSGILPLTTLTEILGDAGIAGSQTGKSFDFMEFSQQEITPEMVRDLLAQLRELLPEARFQQLQQHLVDGNPLPLPAGVAAEGAVSAEQFPLFQWALELQGQSPKLQQWQLSQALSAAHPINLTPATGSPRGATGTELPAGVLRHPQWQPQQGFWSESVHTGFVRTGYVPVYPGVEQGAAGPAAGGEGAKLQSLLLEIRSQIASARGEIPQEYAASTLSRGPSAAAEMISAATSGNAGTMPAIPALLQEILPPGQLLRGGTGMELLNGAMGPGMGNGPATPTPLAGAEQPRPPLTQLPTLNLMPGEKGWGQGLGDRVLWMVGKQVQQASLRITPPNLGPIEIQVSVKNDQASVNFTAQHAVTREALESAIPRLREMFGDNNLQLVNVDVNHRDSPEQRMARDFFARGDESQGSESGGVDEFAAGDSGEGESLVTRLYTGEGLVDDYA